ncbi:MAG: hypothetical protein ABIH36_01130 [bacterium]
MRRGRINKLLLGSIIVAVAGWLAAPSVLLAQEGKACTPGGYAVCPANYICKKKTPSAGFTCECAWGDIEVGLPGKKINIGDSICTLVTSSGGGPGWFVQQIVTAMIALTVMAALVSIVVGGYIYMTAGGSGDRVRTAKIWIGSAILGIILALLAWLILASIASNLVSFSTPSSPSTSPSSPTSTPY